MLCQCCVQSCVQCCVQCCVNAVSMLYQCCVTNAASMYFSEFLDPDAEHQHDESVVSVGITREGSCDLNKLNVWIATLIREQGIHLFRYKGVLSVAEANEKFIFQGVHMVFEGKPAVEWKEDEPRVNKMIFIGRHLKKEELEQGFASCLV